MNLLTEAIERNLHLTLHTDPISPLFSIWVAINRFTKEETDTIPSIGIKNIFILAMIVSGKLIWKSSEIKYDLS